jgi:hypothetical protein
MRHEAIEKLIDALNEGQMRDRVFQSTLSDKVDFALVWTDDPRGNLVNEGAYKFYFGKNTTAGRLLAAKDGRELLTLVIPAGASIPGQYPFFSRREWECTVEHCDAQVARSYDVAAQRYWDLPLEFPLFSKDPNRNRLLIEYTRIARR